MIWNEDLDKLESKLLLLPTPHLWFRADVLLLGSWFKLEAFVGGFVVGGGFGDELHAGHDLGRNRGCHLVRKR